MTTKKILNLYSCLGGNRYKWNEVAELAGVKIEVTAVELDLKKFCKAKWVIENVIPFYEPFLPEFTQRV